MPKIYISHSLDALVDKVEQKEAYADMTKFNETFGLSEHAMML